MNRYNRIFHALRGGKIFSRADQLCTKCNANVIKIPRHFSLCFKSTCQKKSIIKLLWRIIIFFFYSHFRVFHSTDSILLSRIVIKFSKFYVRKNFLSNRRDESMISKFDFSFRKRKFHSNFPWPG